MWVTRNGYETPPLGARRHPVGAVMIRAAPEELEYRGASTNLQATVRFTERVPLAAVARARGRGLYIVELNGRPLYVGVTTTPFALRWSGRLRVFRELRVKPPGSEYTIALAEVRMNRSPGTATAAAWKALLLGVEATVVRYLIKAGQSLTNTHFAGSDALPLGATDRIRIDVLATAAKPAYLPSSITLVGPRSYESGL